MPASLDRIRSDTPMGANLIHDGATFRAWAPHARAVYVLGDFNDHMRNDASLLTRDAHGHWRGFIPGARDRQRYIFYVIGEGSEGRKRDPYARELETPFPSECVLRKPDFPWHESGFVPPRFPDFVIYQLHVGTFYTPNLPNKGGTFLDVARKIPHLAELGVTALQLLPEILSRVVDRRSMIRRLPSDSLRLPGVGSEHHRRTVHLHAPRVADARHSACASAPAPASAA
ncbi:MAG: hypothetical protein ACREX4_20430 [Gammaproteobacteria bacterium]